MTPDDDRRGGSEIAPGQAEMLRRIALHQETAALLRQRAEHAPIPAAAGSLRRRAAEHAHQAQQLRGHLGYRRTGARPLASSGGAPADG